MRDIAGYSEEAQYIFGRIACMRSIDRPTVYFTLEHIRFYFLVFLFYTFYLSFPCGRLS